MRAPAALGLLLAALFPPTFAQHSIDDYGAVPMPDTSTAAGLANARALRLALAAANASAPWGAASSGAHSGASASSGAHSGASVTSGAHSGASVTSGAHSGASASSGAHSGAPASSGAHAGASVTFGVHSGASASLGAAPSSGAHSGAAATSGASASLSATFGTPASSGAHSVASVHAPSSPVPPPVTLAPADPARTALVPAGRSYWLLQTTLTNLVNVTLEIAGELVLSNNMADWPDAKRTPDGYPVSGLLFADCHHLRLTGGGTVQGLGYDWWWANILHGRHRPHMLVTDRTTDLVINNLFLVDSPMYHILIKDVARAHVYNVSITVHLDKQKELLSKGSRWHGKIDIPVFPLNTDGIDPSGRDVLIEDCFIRNYDDAVAVKPANGGDVNSKCSENMLIRNIRVEAGVGMSIGSVPPDPQVACIRNITFENIDFKDSFKSIYIKPNPGDNGTGIIDKITYRNITGKGNLWYPIWLGTQQQDQPSGGTDTGCSFLFPIERHCPTNPRISVSNIRLEDISFSDSLFLPGVFICNSTNPCVNITMKNVISTGEFAVQKDYFCENAEILSEGTTNPVPKCGKSDENGGFDTKNGVFDYENAVFDPKNGKIDSKNRKTPIFGEKMPIFGEKTPIFDGKATESGENGEKVVVLSRKATKNGAH